MSRSVERRWERAAQYLAQGQVAAARVQLEALEAAAPSDYRTSLLAADLAWREDRIRDAVRLALAANEAAPDESQALCGVVESLLRVGEVVAARECLARPALARATEPALLLRLSDFRQRLDENVESLALIERAIAAGADGAEVGFHHGVQLYFNGRLADAESELEACVRQAPAAGRAALALSRLRKQTRDSNHLDSLAAGLARVAPGTRDHAALEFAHSKELDDLGRFGEAWDALARGNAIMRTRNPFDPAAQHTYLERLIDACDQQRVRTDEAVNAEGPQPIFIVGMARSGTTVLERMLGNHSGVASAGELVDFGHQLHWAADTSNTQGQAFLARLPDLDLAEVGRRYLAQTQWRARGKSFYIDKQPPNWVLAGLIHAALPHARLLHMVRDPMDLCFSNWRAFFGDTYAYSYDMADLAAYHQAYLRMMAHWHRVMPGTILDVAYADLVSDPESAMRRVFAHCGLPWEPGCLDIRSNAAPVATLSAAQVRAGLHGGAFGEWRRYQSQLEPLRRALGAA
jgi:tetratricopeptide (TPR) repeat protein